MNPISVAIWATIVALFTSGVAGYACWRWHTAQARVLALTGERDQARRGERAALARLGRAGDYFVAWATFGPFVPAQRDGSPN